MEPAAGAVNFLAHEFRQDEKAEAGEIHRQRAPADPAVIDQAGDDEGKKADDDPVGLLAPELGGERILTHESGAVDGDDAENGEREHDREQHPVEAENFAEKRCHVRSSASGI